MIKKFAAIGTMVLILSTCSSPSQAAELKPIIKQVTQKQNNILNVKQIVLNENRLKITHAVHKLEKYVGKTWYVFSGNTPSGWDCSGLTMWTYEQMGVILYHSASVQKYAGKHYKTPKVGDIVSFGWKGYSGAGHVGIYIGNGKMIHAPSPGHRTRIQNIKQFAKYGYTKVVYTRILNN
jgi:cell wall-associated NlpC family hydrolase